MKSIIASSNADFLLSNYDYHLPAELIAQSPARERDQSRLLVYSRQNKNTEHRYFSELGNYLQPGDLLVLNDTRVRPVRLLGHKIKKDGTPGGKCEIFLLKQLSPNTWETLVRPGKRLGLNTRVMFGAGELSASIGQNTSYGGRVVEFSFAGDFEQLLNRVGNIPLPPYIKVGAVKAADQLGQRYQTVFAQAAGSAAAPTAGLHFTAQLLRQLEEKGIRVAYITLHVGLGTFRPVETEDITAHQLHPENYLITRQTIELIRQTKREGHRVIAVGTTVTRTLEANSAQINSQAASADLSGETAKYIYPGYRFQVIDSLLTNFHLPKSSLLMLVAALTGRENILRVYQEAIEQKYRFFSFGDALLVV